VDYTPNARLLDYFRKIEIYVVVLQVIKCHFGFPERCGGRLLKLPNGFLYLRRDVDVMLYKTIISSVQNN